MESLADHLELIEDIARWHVARWGHLNPSATLAGWTEGSQIAHESSMRLHQQVGKSYASLRISACTCYVPPFTNSAVTRSKRREMSSWWPLRASNAVAEAMAAQRTLFTYPRPEGGVVRIRIGMHTGEQRGLVRREDARLICFEYVWE